MAEIVKNRITLVFNSGVGMVIRHDKGFEDFEKSFLAAKGKDGSRVRSVKVPQILNDTEVLTWIKVDQIAAAF